MYVWRDSHACWAMRVARVTECAVITQLLLAVVAATVVLELPVELALLSCQKLLDA